MKKPSKTFTTEAEWLAARTAGIGGSEAPPAIGASHRKSPLELYAEKVGVASEETVKAENDILRWGHRLEPFIREAYIEETKRQVETFGYHVFQSTDHPFMQCTLDGMIICEEARKDGVYEAKWTTHISEKEILEEVPLEYQIQVQHNMAVTETEWASIAILAGYGKLLYVDVTRDDAFIAALIAKEEELWDRIRNHDPPPPSEPFESSLRALKTLYPVGTGGITLPLEYTEVARQLEIAKSEKKVWGAKENEYKAMMIAGIGKFECGYLSNGQAYTYKQRAGYVVKERTVDATRVLRKVERKK